MKTTSFLNQAPRGAARQLEVAISTRERVIELVKLHGITCEPGPLDAWASAVTRLSDDDVEEDDVFKMILALRRANALSPAEADRLHIQHLREKGA